MSIEAIATIVFTKLATTLAGKPLETLSNKLLTDGYQALKEWISGKSADTTSASEALSSFQKKGTSSRVPVVTEEIEALCTTEADQKELTALLEKLQTALAGVEPAATSVGDITAKAKDNGVAIAAKEINAPITIEKNHP